MLETDSSSLRTTERERQREGKAQECDAKCGLLGTKPQTMYAHMHRMKLSERKGLLDLRLGGAWPGRARLATANNENYHIRCIFLLLVVVLLVGSLPCLPLRTAVSRFVCASSRPSPAAESYTKH